MIRRAALAAAALATLASLTACPAPPRLVRPPETRVSRPPPVPLPAPPDRHDEPALAGPVHVVKPGETIYRIARSLGVEPAALMEANGIEDPRALAVGTALRIPGAPAVAAAPAPAPVAASPGAPATSVDGAAAPAPAADAPTPPAARDDGSSRLAWPLKGVLYGRYGVRAGQRHDGIDIAAPEGTPVHAADAGTVIYVGTQPAFGEVVILRHEGGLVTLYAHNSAVLVKEGARVARGQPIARVGQTGRTTGPHLHFEVRQGTRPRNPLLYLP